MAGVKKITSSFKQLSKEEMKVEHYLYSSTLIYKDLMIFYKELLLTTQLSRNSRMVSIESAKTLSTLSSAVMSVTHLTDLSSEFQPALKQLLLMIIARVVMILMMNIQFLITLKILTISRTICT